MKGLVNAVLRKLSSYKIEEWNKDESISRLPKWLREPLISAYGKKTVTEIEKIQSFTPPIDITCLLYTSPSPRDKRQSRMPSSA